MKRPTIASLESNVRGLNTTCEMLNKQLLEVKAQRDRYKEKVEDLDRDKAWLKQCLQNLLQFRQATPSIADAMRTR